jgi:putative addiction module component (TIGR02574 family)
MDRTEIQRLLALPVDERLELAQMLWQSVEPEDEVRFVSIPEWQRRILDERLANMEDNPEDEQPWEDVKAAILHNGRSSEWIKKRAQ